MIMDWLHFVVLVIVIVVFVVQLTVIEVALNEEVSIVPKHFHSAVELVVSPFPDHYPKDWINCLITFRRCPLLTSPGEAWTLRRSSCHSSIVFPTLMDKKWSSLLQSAIWVEELQFLLLALSVIESLEHLHPVPVEGVAFLHARVLLDGLWEPHLAVFIEVELRADLVVVLIRLDGSSGVIDRIDTPVARFHRRTTAVRATSISHSACAYSSECVRFWFQSSWRISTPPGWRHRPASSPEDILLYESRSLNEDRYIFILLTLPPILM